MASSSTLWFNHPITTHSPPPGKILPKNYFIPHNFTHTCTECCFYLWKRFELSKSLHLRFPPHKIFFQQNFPLTSQGHFTNQVKITLMTTLLPDQLTFYFLFEGDSYCFRTPNLFVFISAREFSFPRFSFHLFKIFTKFLTFLHRGDISHAVKAKIFRFLIERSLVFLRKSSVKPPFWYLSSVFCG